MLPEGVVVASPVRATTSENKATSIASRLATSISMTPPRSPILCKPLVPSASPPGVTLPSGFTFGFYKSPKSTKVPAVEPPHFDSPLRKPVSKKRSDAINKGVGHKIKKPRFKAKDLKKKQHKASHIVHTLNRSSFKRVAGNRISTKSTPSSKKKFHMLSSPGVSLLDSPELGSDFMPDHKNKKFFTSRSRAAATVQINKTIKLSAIYGDITLHRDSSSIPKKNIGRIVEDELQNLLDKESKVGVNEDFSIPLPSVQDSTVASAPTRVISTPSPKKKQMTKINSPRKLFNPSGQTLKGLDLPSNNTTPTRSRSCSPRKPTQNDKSKSKQINNAKPESICTTPIKRTPVRTSPRKNQSPLIKATVASPSRTGSPRGRSPGKMSTPKKFIGSRSSPRKSIYMSPRNRRSPMRHPEYHLAQKDQNCVCCSPNKSMTKSARKSITRICSGSPSRSPRRAAVKAITTTSCQKLLTASKPAIDSSNCDDMFEELNDGDLQDLDKALQELETKENERVKPNTQVNVQRRSPRKDCPAQEEKKSKFKYFPIFDPSKRLSDKKQDAFTFPVTRIKNKKVSNDENQTIIDAGQKRFGVTQCNVCEAMYEIANKGDEACHMKFHNSFLNSLKFTGWKNERIAMEPDLNGGRIIKIISSDPQNWWKKVEEIRDLVDYDLGFVENSVRVKEHTVVFFYIIDKRIAGCLISEFIDKAHRIVPDKKSEVKVLCCSEESIKVTVGVSRIWVAPSYRRNGIATKLVDAMRKNISSHHFLTVDEFAFSDPTEKGLSFGKKYTGKSDFLVYRH